MLLQVKGKQNAFAFDLVLDSGTSQVVSTAPITAFAGAYIVQR